MDIVEVKLLKYTFRFRQLRWREDFNMKFDPKKDRMRTILAHALVEISGLKVTKFADAYRVLNAVPSTIIYRAFIIYKGAAPAARIFHTMGLYRAPEPTKFVKKIAEAEERREAIMDKVEQEMQNKFGHREVAEAKALDQQILRASNLRGAIRKPTGSE